MSDASYAGWFCAIASAESIARKVGVRHRACDAAIASAVDLAVDRSRGEIGIRPSGCGWRPRLRWRDWTISTLFGSTPYCARITLSKLTWPGCVPTTPMRCRELGFGDLGAGFLALALAAGGTHSTTAFLRSVGHGLGIFSALRDRRE